MNFCFRREFYTFRIYALLYSFFFVNADSCSWIILYIPTVLSVFKIATEISHPSTSWLSSIKHSSFPSSTLPHTYLVLLLFQLALCLFKMQIDASEHPLIPFSYIFVSRNNLLNFLLLGIEVVMVFRQTRYTLFAFMIQTTLPFIQIRLCLFLRFYILLNQSSLMNSILQCINNLSPLLIQLIQLLL